jgi:hypothetical protein
VQICLARSASFRHDAGVEGSYRITLGTGLRLYILVFAAVWIGSLLLISREQGVPPSIPLIVSLVGALFFVRFFTLAAEVGPDGIVVRNLHRTMRLPWERIDGFRVQRGLGFGSPLGRTVSLLFDGDHAITVDATMRSWAFTGGHRHVQEMVAKLQASWEGARRERPTAPSDR